MEKWRTVLVERINKQETYLRLLGDKVVVEKCLTGTAKKIKDRHIRNLCNGIVSIDVFRSWNPSK